MKQAGEQTVEVLSGARAEDGTKLEPEEQPARVITPLETTLSLGHGPDGGTPMGALGGRLTEERDAGEVAAHLSTLCASCGNWRRADWLAVFRRWSDPGARAEEAETLARMRGELMYHDHAAPPGVNLPLPEADDVLRHAAGICGPLTEILGEITITFDRGSCPKLDAAGQPLPSMFVHRDAVTKRAAATAYDAILRKAQGR